MDKELKQKWVEALRGGKYQQLSPGGSDWRRNGRHCCIGVLGELLGEQQRMDERTLGGVLHLAGIDVSTKDKLIDMNDRDRKSFAEIADWIEANIQAALPSN